MLKTGYFGLAIIMTLLVLWASYIIIDRTFPVSKSMRKKTWITIGLISWHLYVFALSQTGILNNFTFPPKFALFLVLPLLLFTIIFLTLNKGKQWISNIPGHWLIYIQTFRVAVEILFVLSISKGILHKEMTIEGYNFDMIIGLTAPMVAYFSVQKKKWPLSVALLWNYLGLTVLASIIFIVFTSIYAPEWFGSSTVLLPKAFATYPYNLVAGFLAPLAIFIHVLSIIQLKKDEVN